MVQINAGLELKSLFPGATTLIILLSRQLQKDPQAESGDEALQAPFTPSWP